MQHISKAASLDLCSNISIFARIFNSASRLILRSTLYGVTDLVILSVITYVPLINSEANY